MKITTEAFRDALALAGRAAAKSTPMDILRCARFTAKDGEFTLACHDLTIYAEARGECGAGEMAFCVREDRLDAALETAGDSIDLSLKGSLLTWKSGRARYQMPTLPANDFPVPARGAEPIVTLECPDIAEGLKRVVFACATRDPRPYTTGVCIECSKKDGVTLFATDGTKMASLRMDTASNAEAKPIVHRDVVSALPDGAERIRVYKESVEFDYPNGLVVGRLIEGYGFPDCRRVMGTQKSGATITVDRRALVHAVKAALPFDQQGSIHFVVNGEEARIEAEESMGGRAEVKLDGKSKGKADVWFLSTVITPAIQAASGEELALSLGDSTDNAFFIDGPLHCVCAPVRR